MSLTFAEVDFEDVDQFSEWEVGLGWEVSSTQLGLGSNRIGFDHYALPGLLVGHFHARQSIKYVYQVPGGTVVLLISRSRQPLVWCGAEIPPTLAPIVHSGRRQWAVLPANWDCYEFMVSEELIRRTELFPAEFCEFAVAGLQQVIEAGLGASGWQAVRPAGRADLVPQAREFMAAHMASEINAEDIARALGVSYRVLHYAFRDAVGVSPYRYFLTEKLHAARRILKSADASVSKACASYGFASPSRFSQQYKRLFGELPSETRLRK
jgi:AraC-like DNA-binding protein